MENKLKIVDTAANIVIAIATAVLVYGIFITNKSISIASENLNVSKQQLRVDNDRSIREFTLNIALTTQANMGMGIICAQFLAELSADELRKVYSFDELPVDDAHKEKAEHCLVGLKGDGLLKSKNRWTLTKAGSYYAWAQTFHDLDLFEYVMTAYYSGIVDKDVIKNTFGTTIKSKSIEILIDKLGPKMQSNFAQLRKFVAEQNEKDFIPEKPPLVDTN